jgi:hypothetical protein
LQCLNGDVKKVKKERKKARRKKGEKKEKIRPSVYLTY